MIRCAHKQSEATALIRQNSAQSTKIASLEASVADFQTRNEKLKDVIKAMKAKLVAHEETIKKVCRGF